MQGRSALPSQIAGLLVAACLLLVPQVAAGQAPAGGARDRQLEKNCPRTVPPGIVLNGGDEQAGTPQGDLKIDPGTRWQPMGGEVRFTLSGLSAAPENIRIYFRWQDATSRFDDCVKAARIRLISDSGDQTVGGAAGERTFVYGARVPMVGDDGSHFPWIDGWTHRIWTSAVPPIDMYVHALIPEKDPKSAAGETVNRTEVVFVTPMGITSVWVAVVLVAAAVFLAWLVFHFWAVKRGIGGGFLLRMISTPAGVASLSQFQILLWTLVIGAGIIYVMLLSGNLIDIPSTTLALLGVTGIALVGSKIQSDAANTPQHANPPGIVGNLAVSGAATSSSAVLTWAPPMGAAQPFSYTVQMRLSGQGGWSTVATDIAGPPYAVAGLDPVTSYDFQVFAINQAGPGPASIFLPVKTIVAVGDPQGAPGQVTGLTATAAATSSITLGWAAMAPAPTGYTVQYRPARTLPWATFSNNATSPVTVTGLDGGISYEFQVFAVTNGVAGAPSALLIATTKPRTPQWSDLVMSGDEHPEIDLSRVQMLLFTSIAALFTGLTLIDTGQIPDIPLGVLALVGLVNGVYLASKMTPGR